MYQRRSIYGYPTNTPVVSQVTVKMLDLSGGLDFQTSPMNLQPGSTISAENWVMREGGLTPRPGLTKLANNPALGSVLRGGSDIVTSEGEHFQIISGTTRFAYRDSNDSWSNLSWIPGFATGRQPDPGVSFWDVTQSVRSDGSIVAFMAPTTSTASGGAMMCWLPGQAIFSTVTGNVPAKYATSFDNYLVAWSTGTFSGATYISYPTRVQWSDRGDPLTWEPASGNLAGFEDLLDARGKGTGIKALENRVILFTEQEIWQGISVGVPGVTQFQFAPVDRGVGCRKPQTICSSPEGLIFVGHDNYIYLLPKTGGPATIISKAIAPILRNSEFVWAVYDVTEHRYQLYTRFPQVMTAEADDLVVTAVTGSSSNVSWLNLTFDGDENVEVWLESAQGWQTMPIKTLAINGLTVQQTPITGLTSNTSYRLGIRMTRDGNYTSGYSSADPDEWISSLPTIVPYSSVFTTNNFPGAPTNLNLSDCSEYSVGPKNFSQKVLAWTNSLTGGAPYYTDLVRSNLPSLAGYSLETSMVTTSSRYTFQDLVTSPTTVTYWGVWHREISGVTGPVSNVLSTENLMVCP